MTFRAGLEFDIRGAAESVRALERVTRSAESLSETSAQIVKTNAFGKLSAAIQALGARLPVFKNLQTEIAGAAAVASGLERAVARTADAGAGIVKVTSQVQTLRDEAKKASAALQTIREPGTAVVGRLGANLISNLGGQAIGALSSDRAVGSAIGTGFNVGGSLAANLFGAGAPLATVATALGAVGVAAGATSIAVSKFTEQLDRNRKEIEAAQQSIANIAAFVAVSSSEDARARIEQTKERIKAAQAEIEANKAAIAIANQRADALAQANEFNPVLRAIIETQRETVISPFRKAVEDQAQAVALAESEIRRLESALGDGSFAAADAAKQEKELAKARAEAAVQDSRDRIQRTIDLTRAEREGGAESVRARIQAIQDERTALERELAVLVARRESLTKEETALLAEYQSRLARLTTELNAQNTSILAAAEARDRENAQIEKTQAIISAVAAQRERDFQEALKISKQISDLQRADREKQAQAAADRAIQERRATETADFQARIAAAKQAETQAANAARLAKIDQEGLKKAQQVRKEAADAAIKAERVFNDRIAKINSDFMQREMTALAAFRLSEGRRTEDYYKERNRKLEDLQRSLTDLAAAGDVVGFIAAQRAAETDLRRGQEDFDTAGRRVQEDFLAERAQAQQNRQAQLEELRQSYAQERQERQNALAQRLSDLKVELETQRQAEIERQTTTLTESQRIEEEFAARRLVWQQEDQARREQLEREAFNRQIAELTNRQKQLASSVTSVVRPVQQTLQSIGDSVVNFINKLRTLGGGSQRAGGGTAQITANATGGIYTKPELSLLGERAGFGDLVIPFRQSEGIVPALERVLAQTNAGRAPITINLSGIGAGVDQAMLREELTRFAEQLAQVIEES